MDYKASILYKKLQSGLSIPITILFIVILSGYLFSFIAGIYDKDWRVNFSIAQTKALLNADSGIALDGYPVLFKKDYVKKEQEVVDGPQPHWDRWEIQEWKKKWRKKKRVKK